MDARTRIPTQKRALEKYEKIINAATKLFHEKGYYSIITTDIAKEANVSTGTVYSYFKDKKDIYIQVIRKTNFDMLIPTFEFWTTNKLPDNPVALKELFQVFIKLMIKLHDFSKLYHDELTALQLIDDDIKKVCQEQQIIREQKIKEIFRILSFPFKSEADENTFLHYTYFLVDHLCHLILYENTGLNIDLYIDCCVNMLYSLLETTSDLSPLIIKQSRESTEKLSASDIT